MTDRLLNASLNLTIVSLTGAVATGSLALGYWGILQLLQGHVTSGPMQIVVGVALGFGAWLLARNRNDLADC